MHHPDATVTWIFAALLALMVVALAMEEKLHAKKSIITGVTAAIALFLADAFHILPLDRYTLNLGDGHIRELPVYIPGIEWEVIAIIFGASLFVDVTAKSGLFSWIAVKLTRLSGGDPYWLLFYYGGMTILFSAFLNNVAAMLIVGSLTVVSLEKLERRKLLMPFLLIEGLLTNVGGLLTLISSVPNIIVGKAAGIEFVVFFLKAAPFVVVAGVITILLGARIFHVRRLTDPEEKRRARALVESFNPADTITSRGFFAFSGIMFVALVLMLSLTGFLPIVKDLGMGYVALVFGLVSALRFKASVDKTYAALDWDLLAFFGTLFIVVDVMEHAGVLGLIGQAIGVLVGLGDQLGAGSLLAASAVTSSVTDNIPLAAVLANILGSMDGVNSDSNLWWCVIFGANLGGNLTPIGSASTVVAVTIMHKHGIKLSFFGFVKAALPFAAVQIALAMVYVLVVL